MRVLRRQTSATGGRLAEMDPSLLGSGPDDISYWESRGRPGTPISESCVHSNRQVRLRRLQRGLDEPTRG